MLHKETSKFDKIDTDPNGKDNSREPILQRSIFKN